MSQQSQDYFKKYEFIRFRREDGILEMTIHTNGDSLRWGPPPHDELRRAFNDIAEDRENRVVIFTGTGEEFTGPICSNTDQPIERRMTPSDWDCAISCLHPTRPCSSTPDISCAATSCPETVSTW